MSRSGEPIVKGVQEYLAQTGIDFAILFGSHVRGTADESPVVNVAFRFPEEMDDHERKHEQREFIERLARGDV